MQAKLLWLALLAKDGALAIRVDDTSLLEDAVEQLSAAQGSAMSPEQQATADEIAKAIDQGKKGEASLTCEDFRKGLPLQISGLASVFKSACSGEACDFAEANFDQVMTSQLMINAVTTGADRKKCLDEVMGAQEVQDSLKELLSFVPQLLQSSSSDYAGEKKRYQEAYLQLVSFQEGALKLAKSMADRKELLQTDVDISADCPENCKSCSKDGAFAFQCYTSQRQQGLEPPHDFFGSHLVCEEKVKLSLFSWARMKRGAKWSRRCTVHDWQESAVQHVHVGAVLACTAQNILSVLHSSRTQGNETFATCLAVEQGNHVSDDNKRRELEYRFHPTNLDGIVSPEIGLVMNSVITIGLASGLAGVRAATRGNGKFAGPGSLATPSVDFTAPFSEHLGELTVRPQDRDMYGDREHVRRTETLNRLGACEDVYSLQMQDTFLEGFWPLQANSMYLNQQLERPETGSEEPQKVKAAAIGKDPFGDDPFGQPGAKDPFGDPFGDDPFGQPGAKDPFGDPFGDDPFGQPGGRDPFGDDDEGDENNFRPLPGDPPRDGDGSGSSPPRDGDLRRVRWGGHTAVGWLSTFAISTFLTYFWMAICWYMLVGFFWLAILSLSPMVIPLGLFVSSAAFLFGTVGIWTGVGMLVGQLSPFRSTTSIETCLRKAKVDYKEEVQELQG